MTKSFSSRIDKKTFSILPQKLPLAIYIEDQVNSLAYICPKTGCVFHISAEDTGYGDIHIAFTTTSEIEDSIVGFCKIMEIYFGLTEKEQLAELGISTGLAETTIHKDQYFVIRSKLEARVLEVLCNASDSEIYFDEETVNGPYPYLHRKQFGYYLPAHHGPVVDSIAKQKNLLDTLESIILPKETK